MLHASRAQSIVFAVLLMLLATPFSSMLNNTDYSQSNFTDESSEQVSARAQTTWSGTQTLTSSYTISVQDELIISACTIIKMDDNVRIYVDGRLTIEGTNACPVTMSANSLGDHEGIQFNSSSTGRGSVIDNLTIEDALYGITMFGGNPIIHNLTIVNPDRVGIDMFNNAAPQIYDLFINQAGRDLPWQSDWRFGLGVSVGAGSTPIIIGAHFSDILTRGINVWGAAGGIFRNITMDNVSGSSWVMAAGVWVEDSVPLLTDITIDKSDNGIVIRHVDDSGNTRAVVKRADISNSMYRGVYVDKQNHTNFTNYETADFTDLTVTGTGGPGALTGNIAYAAIEVNATGAWFENTLVDQSTTVGVRLYFVDSSTTFQDLVIRDSGDTGQGPHDSGLAIRSSYFAPTFDGLEISGSSGSAIYSSSGGAMQGSDWYLHNNSKQGLFIDSATVVVEDMVLENNSFAGAHVHDSRYVTLQNVTSQYNGIAGSASNPQQTAGLVFTKANDIESVSGDVRCRDCDSSNNQGSGIHVEDSVDLWLENIHVFDNNDSYDPVFIDNGGLTIGQQGGQFHLINIQIDTERSGPQSGPALYIEQAAGEIDMLSMSGNHTGIYWNADHNGNRLSSLSRSYLSGSGCLDLSDHPSLSGIGNVITNDCTGSITMTNSQVNWSGLTDSSGTTILTLDSTSDLHLHQPNNVAIAQAVMATGATIDEAWDMTIWVLNNNSNGIPNAYVNLTFDQFEPSIDEYTNDLGTLFLPDFISRRWSSVGVSAATVVTIECAYDSISNSTSVTLDSDKIAPCMLPLDNQAPFLIWSTPEDSSVYPSQGGVFFNASDSWDLDDDELTFSWTSDLDGDVLASCTGPGNPFNPNKGFAFTANSNGAWGCSLSDGIHTITLEICDDAGHCVSEQRVIELSNQAPVIVFDVTPGLTPWSELVIPRTQNVLFNLTGTFDPEGDSLICWIERSYQNDGVGQQSGCPTEVWINFSMAETVPSTFNLEIYAYDGINIPPSEYIIPVELYNEVPEPEFTLTRLGNASEDEVTLDGTATIDPEGDTLEIEYWSNLDGQLSWNNTEAGKVWTGFLSRGIHSIEMRVVDDRPEHINSTRVTTMLVDVENSLPRSVIDTPLDSLTYDSSELIWFSANGSGDFDSWCGTFPDGDWYCADNQPAAGSEFLVVTWESDIDGRLTPEGEDWLIFDGRLSAATHNITLSVDDGIHSPQLMTIVVEVTQSAPVLGLVTPSDGDMLKSSEVVNWDAKQSVDYDGDEFVMSVRSNLLDDPILEDVDPFVTHTTMLPSGTHTIEITLTDSTDRTRTEFITLTVNQSDPQAVLISPENRLSIAAGNSILLEEESTDADDDMVTREWRYWAPGATWPEVISTNSLDTYSLPPGEHHLSLYVEDSRGGWDEIHVNVTIQSSLPKLDANSLIISPASLTAGVKTEFSVSIVMVDEDGTTDNVRATLTHGIQFWEINMSYSGADNIWVGTVELTANDVGRPNLKVIATDGDSVDASFDEVSKTIVVSAGQEDVRVMTFVIAATTLVVVFGLIGFIASARRKKIAELDMIESWDAFGKNKKTTSTQSDTEKAVPKLESGLTDSAHEVEAEEAAIPDIEEAMLEQEPKPKVELDWDNI
ncbi:right-handed parallel beta-helix repeat-containing protein [Candidatus Poseidoniaceae archaeon]|nr:right-handed parallel beta-helix repeat-containing protein [Candidatus Poseidoniaceae archaeon]